MNKDKLLKAQEHLDSAICKIDALLRRYPFVTKMDMAKQGRLELEMASRMFAQELNGHEPIEDSKAGPTGDDGKSDSQISKPDDSVNKSDDSNSKQVTENSETVNES